MTVLTPLRYFASKLTVIFTVLSLQLTYSVNAIPLVDGFASAGEYSNMLDVQWYNDHNEGGTQFHSTGDQTTAVYYDWSTATSHLYLYLEAPLSAKNMIWGDGWTEDEALKYYQHWCSPGDGVATVNDNGDSCGHHKDGFAKFQDSMGTFEGMTGSEKTMFAGITADLASNVEGKSIGKDKKKGKDKGKDKEVSNNILEYKDSVDYAIAELGCDISNCNASDTAMSFEFLFGGFKSQDSVDIFLADITKSGIVFHLSPERGGPGSHSNVSVPEPSVFWLFALTLLLLIYTSKRNFNY